MADRNWMPWYVGDYLRDTGDLSPLEHGVYMLLLGDYWTRGGPMRDALPTHYERIARASTDEERAAVARILARYFPLVDGLHRNKRLDAELERNSRIRESRTGASKKAAAARWGNASRMPDALPDGMPRQCPTPPHITNTPDGVLVLDNDAPGNASRKKRGTQLPADFTAKAAHRTLADSLGVNLEAELPTFLDFHGSRGSVFKDWDLALNTWLRKAVKFRRDLPRPGSGRHGGFQGRNYGSGLGPDGEL